MMTDYTMKKHTIPYFRKYATGMVFVKKSGQDDYRVYDFNIADNLTNEFIAAFTTSAHAREFVDRYLD